MANDPRWRQQFTQLCEGAMVALAMPKRKREANLSPNLTAKCSYRFKLAGTRFEATHFPEGQDRFVLQCELGCLDAKNRERVMKSLLTYNQTLAHTSGGMFTLADNKSAIVKLSLFDSLKQMKTADEFLKALNGLAAFCGTWKSAGFAEPNKDSK